MALRDKLANAIDKAYEAHPEASALRDQLDSSGIQSDKFFRSVHLTRSPEEPGSQEHDIIDARRTIRANQIEDRKADLPESLYTAAHMAIKTTIEHQLPTQSQLDEAQRRHAA